MSDNTMTLWWPELKPCPRCGSTECGVELEYSQNAGVSYTAYCKGDDCEARTAKHETDEAAITSWNGGYLEDPDERDDWLIPNEPIGMVTKQDYRDADILAVLKSIDAHLKRISENLTRIEAKYVRNW